MEKNDFTTQPSAAVVDAGESQFASTLERTSTVKKTNSKFLIGASVVVLFLGLGTGYVAAALTKSVSSQPALITTTSTTQGTQAAAPAIKAGQVVGSKDASAFKDSVEGILVPGGIGSEGSHHIVRTGGPSQYVYLTSSIMDLKLFEGAKVKVYGETFKAQKAGWLMDVGRIEVEQLNAPLPAGTEQSTTQQGD